MARWRNNREQKAESNDRKKRAKAAALRAEERKIQADAWGDRAVAAELRANEAEEKLRTETRRVGEFQEILRAHVRNSQTRQRALEDDLGRCRAALDILQSRSQFRPRVLRQGPRMQLYRDQTTQLEEEIQDMADQVDSANRRPDSEDPTRQPFADQVFPNRNLDTCFSCKTIRQPSMNLGPRPGQGACR
ncbi:hypothetical protein H2204_006083 [Knufia peltigerae]|uniref:Uncharacterized protein n=1 Tax=Knufia peltigerae TaxID=1002370 RepID=A0AA38Y4C3_9EURO|nr:hypothetical protein H2204_006083 [Knufia peltigerae]